MEPEEIDCESCGQPKSHAQGCPIGDQRMLELSNGWKKRAGRSVTTAEPGVETLPPAFNQVKFCGSTPDGWCGLVKEHGGFCRCVDCKGLLPNHVDGCRRLLANIALAESIVSATPEAIPRETILAEAARLTSQDRNKAYGHPSKNFADIATMWELILGAKVTPEQVGLCMIAVKLCRQTHKSQRDNLVDIAGFARTVEMLDD